MYIYFTGDQVGFFDNVNDSGQNTRFTGVTKPFAPTDVIRIKLDDRMIDQHGEFHPEDDMYIREMVIIREDGSEYKMRISDGKIKDAGKGKNTEQGDAFFSTATQFELPKNWPGSKAGDDQKMVFTSLPGGLTAPRTDIQRKMDIDYDGNGQIDGHPEKGNGIFNVNNNLEVPCFGADTLIKTADGETRAADLSVGDLVVTRDAGLQPVRWVGRRLLDADTLKASPNLRPIRIHKGALGNGSPESDLLVSPQHRVLVRSGIARRMFGTDEVLVAAKMLLAIDGIEIAEDVAEIEYVHFLFDTHQVVFSNGAETESLYTGPQALKAVGEVALHEIYTIFPELRDRAPDCRPEGARKLLNGREGRKLAERHMRNSRALVM